VSTFDISIARNIQIGGAKNIQVRLDAFNAFNASAITGRNASMTLTDTTPTATISNLPYDAAGNLIATRSQPSNAGFGVANAYQKPRSIQIQIRLGF
jgi:YD repeat-containing protein